MASAHSIPATLPTRRIGGARVADVGEGPAVVLLHGYPDALPIFSRLAPLLSGRRVLALDWPGQGRSDAVEHLTPAGLADWLAARLDDLGVARATLVAQDMAALPALSFAASRPERVRRLVVMNALVDVHGPTSPEIRLLRAFAGYRLGLRFAWPVFAQCERTNLPAGDALTDDVRKDLWTSFRRADVRRTLIRMCAAWETALPGVVVDVHRVRDAAVPLLALWGERGHHFPVPQGRWLADAADARLEVVPGGTHWMVWSSAEAVAGRILAFDR